MTPELKRYFESSTSSLALHQNNSDVKWEDARNYACEDIASKLTSIPEGLSGVLDYDFGSDFCFMVRVATGSTLSENYVLDAYMKEFKDRHFISFSTITPANISHYKTSFPFVLAYNIPADAIAHIFPYDSNTATGAAYCKDLTPLPSLWLTLDELNDLTEEVGVYNQITCSTKLGGQILKPCAVITFDKSNPTAETVAQRFNLPVVIVHPEKTARKYNGDALVKGTNLLHLKNVLKDKYTPLCRNPLQHRCVEALMEDIDNMSSEYHKFGN